MIICIKKTAGFTFGGLYQNQYFNPDLTAFILCFGSGMGVNGFVLFFYGRFLTGKLFPIGI